MTDNHNNSNHNNVAAFNASFSSSGSGGGGVDAGGAVSVNTAQSVRRKQIQEIMSNPTLSQAEKNKQIHGLMDGRRSSMGSNLSRSVHSTAASTQVSASSTQQQQQQHHYVNNLARVAVAAAEFYSSDDEGDAIMLGNAAPRDIYDYNQHDNRSVASSISHTSFQHDDDWSDDSPLDPNDNVQQQPPPPRPPAAAAAAASGAPHQRPNWGRSFSLQDFGDDSRATAAANMPFLFNTCTPAAATAAAADGGATQLAQPTPQQVSRLLETSRPPCAHYQRNCTIIAACCGLAFGCRICHDECPVLPPPIHVRQRRLLWNSQHGLVAEQVVKQAQQHHHHHSGNGGPGGGAMERRRSMPLENEAYNDPEEEENQHHLIDRFAIREVICRQCFTRQSSKTNVCKTCGITFGEYHCHICNLWMSNAELPYHCTECGFCRVGGREHFQHCRDCGMCIDRSLFSNHNCKAGKYNSNCPVCQEDLFQSRQASHEMPCGHAIHWHCFKELTSFDTRCPVCKKTAETPEQMASTWSALAMGIALQPVPPDLSRVVNIFCNDCEERDYERRWHFLGVRCLHCLSFNTNVEQIVLQGLEAAQYLDAQEAARADETGLQVPPTIVSTSAAPAAAPAAAPRSNDNDDDDVMMDEDDDDLEPASPTPGGVDTSSGTGSTDFRH